MSSSPEIPQYLKFFPHTNLRAGQKDMLKAAADIASKGGVLLIDAPTGSGKSSIIAPLIAEAKGKKIIVAVRTISQLNVFIKEISLIRKEKKKGLKFSYLIGKRNMCPLCRVGDVYRQCEVVKSLTTTLMRERAVKGSLVPSKDPEIIRQINLQDNDNPIICPYYINSRVFLEGDEGIKLIPSKEIRQKAEYATMNVVQPDKIHEYAKSLCPYDLMMTAAKHADIIIVNYHHLLNDEIRTQLLVTLDVDPKDIIVAIDEAHNVGEFIKGIQTTGLKESDILLVSNELSSLKNKVKGVEAVNHVLPRIRDFMNGLKLSKEIEDWFDPAIFDKFLTKGSLYPSMASLVEDIIGITDIIREKNLQSGNFQETATERLCEFLYRIHCSSTDSAYLTIFRKVDDSVLLEVKNIDPSAKLQEIATSHHALILFSGTLSPIHAYKMYYFPDLIATDYPVESIVVPIGFPKENRLILTSKDITTTFSMRQNNENIKKIINMIIFFSKTKGNLAVFFPSYQLMEEYYQKCSGLNKKVIIEPRDSKEASKLLNDFFNLSKSKTYGILFAVCGGKWSEGIDYKGDLLSGVLVVGLPLAPYTQVRNMEIQYYMRKFGRHKGEYIAYILPAINKAAQALGRVIRNPTDRGLLILGDSRFLEEDIQNGLPSWIAKEMIGIEVNSIKKVVENFNKI